jgi:hypothetical protein
VLLKKNFFKKRADVVAKALAPEQVPFIEKVCLLVRYSLLLQSMLFLRFWREYQAKE